MLATLQSATEAPTVVPPVALSAVPARFWEGDRVQRFESVLKQSWRRTADGMWYLCDPTGEPDGLPLEDAVMRSRLMWDEANKNVLRFSPRYVAATDPLPGQPIADQFALNTLLLDAPAAVPFVASSGERRGFWSLHDLVAVQAGDEAAAYVPAVVPIEQAREALVVMLEEHRAELALHRPAGRLYARYQTFGAYSQGEKERIQVRTFVYVLTGRR
ncbi:hypothetical protein AB0G49_14190 [Streptomyces longwoodensis]|uniref:hypothetical protein n=1 Tax=Streptomyces longwoodensis TaxID=68231 RepID=UPI0033F0608D